MIKKTQIKLGDSFEKKTNRLHLIRIFPFLKNTYRKLEQKELNDLKVLHEIFGETETDLTKLKVVFEYQNLIQY